MLEKLQGYMAFVRASLAPRGENAARDEFLAVGPDTDSPTLTSETITLPGPIDRAPERIVRPALFVLFRIAVGPSADYYGPRFLAFERAGSSMAGWHWPALFAPALWAFYRKLWGAGLAFALLPLAGAWSMAFIAPWLEDSTWLWIACAVLLTVVLPAVSGAALATALLYRRVRRRIRAAEAGAMSASQVASRVSDRAPVSPHAAALFGSLAFAVYFGIAGPILLEAYNEHAVRVKVGKALVGVQPVKAQIEDALHAVGRWPRPAAAKEISARAGAVLFDEVAVDATTGRVKLAVGPSIPELGGKAILLVPAMDKRERVHWYCVPVGIADRYLPRACRQLSR